jgi:hypothetical protein
MLGIIPLLLTLTGIQSSNLNCKDLIDGCKLNDDRFVCSKSNLKLKISYNGTYPNCSTTMRPFLIYFNLNKPAILDTSFNLTRIEELAHYIGFDDNEDRYYYVRNIKGFDINYNIYPKFINFFDIRFYETSFEFYSNGKLIRSCDDLTPGIFPAPFFRMLWVYFSYLRFKTVKFTTRICPLVFHSNHIYMMSFDYLIETFYKRNILEFHHLENVTDINSFIRELYFYNTEKIEFKSALLNSLLLKT